MQGRACRVTRLENTSLLCVVAVPDLMYTGSVISAGTAMIVVTHERAFAAMWPIALFSGCRKGCGGEGRQGADGAAQEAPQRRKE
jgi:hypothetical protein